MTDSDNIMLSSTISMNSIHDPTRPDNVQSIMELNNQGLPLNILNEISSVDNNLGTISFHNINYIIKNAEESNKSSFSKYLFCPWMRPVKMKQILFSISGRFTNGLHAILGPTGCGKSTLLDILADRKDRCDVSGDIFIDGFRRHSSSSWLKNIVGYVVQDSVLCDSLTVRENLCFSANLRLSKSMSINEKHQRVWSVICELGLEHCADVYVGTEFLRGISGGEKKRTSIGMELILSPRILLLDEPTTGLDAATAINVIECLKQLSRKGKTIVLSIHQPRYSIFKLFDTVLFMCKGQCLFHGLTRHVIPYFAAQGYQCDLHDNPADFVLNILSNARRNPEMLGNLNEAYIKSTMFRDLSNSMMRTNSQSSCGALEDFRRPYKFKTLRSIGKEIWYISKRTLLNSARNPTLVRAQIITSVIMGLLLGLVFNNLTTTADPGIQNRRGALFFMVMRPVVASLTALEPFLKERVLFIHEYVSGYYSISSFFLAKVICDLFMRITTTIIFSMIAYPLTGLVRTVSQFLIFVLTMFMATLFGSAMSFFISATTPVLGVAMTIVAVILGIMIVFSGFLIQLAIVFKWLSWIRWISVFYYASNVLLINEFQGLKFCLANMSNVCPITGDDVLNYQGIDHDSSWDLWKYFFGLTLITAGFFILAYIQLLRIRKTK